MTACPRCSPSTARSPGSRRATWLFSRLFTLKAPYFGTVRPQFTALRPNYAELTIRKRRRVHNHIKTVHVIAICNGLEAAMGALAEATVPRDRRWIPKGMDVSYTAKAVSDITCIAETDPERGPETTPTCRSGCGRCATTGPPSSRASSGSG